MKITYFDAIYFIINENKIALTGNFFLDYVNLSNDELNLERGMLLEKKRIIY